MHLVTYSIPSGIPSVGLLKNERIYDLPGCATLLGLDLPADMLSLLIRADERQKMLTSLDEYLEAHDLPSWPAHDVQLWAPVPRPGKVLAVAGNFQSHLLEGGAKKEVEKERTTPRFFLKPATAVIGPGQPIVRPALSPAVDYELELGVVIGRRGRCIPVAQAIHHVAGYTIFNDVSARRLTLADRRDPRTMDDFFDWLNGKWFDSFAPMGPFLATTEDIPDPQALRMRLWVNGELRQDGSTGQMIFSVAELVSFISDFVTLEPGDVIATGTPSGVGDASGRYLKAGDIVAAEIEGLGRLKNHVVDETCE